MESQHDNDKEIKGKNKIASIVIVGTADKIIPFINSEIFKDKIKGAKVETFVEGGHALMFQFPERLSKVINTFLDK